ncbi:MAG: lasso peptide [Richelia sp. SM1_7_0]|nr:lasso peptide [Richelia sp. SM1_7_0]
MKKAYNSPNLTAYGNIESITQAFGNGSADDTVEINGKTFKGSDFGLSGSIDGIIVPKP